MRDSEDGLCVPPTLTLSKGFLEEKVSPGFGPTRKRPLIIKAEQEDAQDGERVVSHAEKRARLSTGEDLLNRPSCIVCLFIFSHPSYSSFCVMSSSF